ncbi:L,D-transpeptidase family protein [Solibacillus sp. FSL H8-0538]|uniref:L,D-transpeptidase family protein n=1 Tax=Solibacillus sp. FSL H8-0538 TaxID=2921400 RepID=UPI0030FA0FDE
MIHKVKPAETLTQISRDYCTPLSTILSANSTINPNVIYIGQSIIIPGFPNPNTIPYQLEISITNRWLRLVKEGAIQKQYPIAVGKMLSNTPVGNYIIIKKEPNPGGSFGTMWIKLSKEHYGIHGTNNPSSIGKAASHGCIHMHNEDIDELARMIAIGTIVLIHA